MAENISKYRLRIGTPEEVRKLVDLVEHSGCEANLSNSRGVVDAKSLIGAMSLDLSSPITLEVIGSKADEDALMTSIRREIEGEVVRL